MLPAIRDLNVPVVLVNVQKLKALDYDHTDIATWLGEGYACGAVGEAVADLERAGKRHAVITGVVEGGDPGVQAEIEKVKEALKGTDSDMIKAATEGLSKKFSDLAGKIYQQQAPQGDPNMGGQPGAGAQSGPQGDFVDADFTEVKDDDKK